VGPVGAARVKHERDEALPGIGRRIPRAADHARHRHQQQDLILGDEIRPQRAGSLGPNLTIVWRACATVKVWGGEMRRPTAPT
jgi:hypothetical protein